MLVAVRNALTSLIRWMRGSHAESERLHNGACDLCKEYGIVWLDGVGILCWEHYGEYMQGDRDRRQEICQRCASARDARSLA